MFYSYSSGSCFCCTLFIVTLRNATVHAPMVRVFAVPLLRELVDPCLCVSVCDHLPDSKQLSVAT